MSDSSSNRQYRIGDFAKYMGVTPDFLKHYEEQGLVHASHRNGGYRFYDFQQSARILEYMRLRNCGVPLKDIRTMLSSTSNESIAMLDERFEELKKRIEFETALLEEHERFKAWYAKRLDKPIDWEIRDVEAFCFLPHSDRHDFLKDERIYNILKNWVAWMPVVKSCLLLDPTQSSQPVPFEWGLAIPASKANRYRLPRNSIVSESPAGKALIYHFIDDAKNNSFESLTQYKHPIFNLIRSLSLKPAGKLHVVIDMKFSDDDGRLRSTCGRIILPLE